MHGEQDIIICAGMADGGWRNRSIFHALWEEMGSLDLRADLGIRGKELKPAVPLFSGIFKVTYWLPWHEWSYWGVKRK